MWRIFLARVCALGFICLLAGCADYFPSFDGPLAAGGLTTNVPVKLVARRVQCELQAFMNESQMLLEKDSVATLSLNVQTDNTGKLSYLGIDLSKLGPLAPLSDLVTAASKVPSLQASGQVKSTISSQVDFNILQSAHPLAPDCTESNGKIFRYYLKEWLEKFQQNSTEGHFNKAELCMTKITLKTTFAVVLDVNGGLSPLVPSTVILPISGTNFDYSPTFTHFLNITLIPKKSEYGEKETTLCKAAGSQASPIIQHLPSNAGSS
jgi:hypothetical protein